MTLGITALHNALTAGLAAGARGVPSEGRYSEVLFSHPFEALSRPWPPPLLGFIQTAVITDHPVGVWRLSNYAFNVPSLTFSRTDSADPLPGTLEGRLSSRTHHIDVMACLLDHIKIGKQLHSRTPSPSILQHLLSLNLHGKSIAHASSVPDERSAVKAASHAPTANTTMWSMLAATAIELGDRRPLEVLWKRYPSSSPIARLS